MNWSKVLGDLNYVGVAVAAVAAMVLGFAWYHWAVFGKAWASALGITKEQADNAEGLAPVLGLAVVGSLAAAVVLAAMMRASGTGTVGGGLLFGAVAGVALRFLSSLLYHNGFARRPTKLTLIDGAYDVTQLALMGAIIGGF